MVKRPSERKSLNVPSFLPSWQLFFFSQSSVRRKQDTAIRGQSLKTVFWLELFVYSKRSQSYTWTNRRVVFFVKNFIDFKRNFQWSCTVFMKHRRLLSSSWCYCIDLACFLYILEQFCWIKKSFFAREIEGNENIFQTILRLSASFLFNFFLKKKTKKKRKDKKKKTDKRKKTYINVVVRILKLHSRTI